MREDEWHGEPHTLIVHAVHPPHGPLDDGCLDYDLEHPPSCREETIGEGAHSYTQWACEVAHMEGDSGLPFTLRYSGTPITEPGTYQIRSWGYKTWTECGYEYDNGIGVIAPEAGAA